MKTLLSILLIGYTVAVSGQNEENYNIVQQQVRTDNNIENINAPYIRGIQEVQTRGNALNIEPPQVNLNINLNLNVPSINRNINHVKQEKVKKVSPKRLEDYRIKTGKSTSGRVSHNSQKENKSFQKKVLKPVKCWVQRTFKHTAKFKLSCECFKF
jgi:hypothetical protein